MKETPDSFLQSRRPGTRPVHRSNPGVGAGVAPQALGVGLPLRFVLTGIVWLVLALIWVVVRPDLLSTYHYNQSIVALTHAVTLGWLASVVMGAMYQLVPVALETTLDSPRLARAHFPLHLLGVAGMVWMFWTWRMEQVAWFGSLFGVGVLMFAYNIGRTLLRIPSWNVIAGAIASALCWLVLTMSAGLFVAISKVKGLSWLEPVAQMHAHAHLGVVGFFVLMTVGVSYKLVPMFTLSELQSPRRAWTSLVLLNVGLAGAVPSVMVQSGAKFFFGLVICAGLGIYAVELMAILRQRKRRALDWALVYFLSALAGLLPVSVLGLVLAWRTLPLTARTGQLENVYGFVALIGVLSFAILGMLYKILPFLAWYASYSKEIGRSKVPTLSELYSTRLQAWGYGLFMSGLAITAGGAAWAEAGVVRGGALLLVSSVALFLWNVGMILSHLVKPRLQPLPVKRANVAAVPA
jgi:cbb3-type cytochrome oxidase subunit 1